MWLHLAGNADYTFIARLDWQAMQRKQSLHKLKCDSPRGASAARARVQANGAAAGYQRQALSELGEDPPRQVRQDWS